METVTCNLCGGNRHALVYRQPDIKYHPDQWFSTVCCEDCGLAFVNPRPTRAEISEYYPSQFYDYFAQSSNQEFHLRRYRTEASILHRHMPSSGQKRLLDIGCANGAFPRFMRDAGWEVEGVEVSRDSQPITDFLVYRQEFPEISVPPGYYDALTAWAVLEHVHDPMAHFRKASHVLKPGGVFVFLVTNFSSLTSCRLFGEDIPRHLYFFTEETVRGYLQRTGLELVQVQYSDRVYSMLPVNWLRYYLHRLSGRSFEWHDSRLTHDRFLEDHGLSHTALNKFKFFAQNPISLIDRLSAPLFARYQLLTHSYGIVTYAVRRLGGGSAAATYPSGPGPSPRVSSPGRAT